MHEGRGAEAATSKHFFLSGPDGTASGECWTKARAGGKPCYCFGSAGYLMAFWQRSQGIEVAIWIVDVGRICFSSSSQGDVNVHALTFRTR